MKTPHKHAELIKAWAEGHPIQVSLDGIGWFSCDKECAPSFLPIHQYRIKPEPKPDVVRFVVYEWDPVNERTSGGIPMNSQNCFFNIKLIFYGETGKLKSAEVL